MQCVRGASETGWSDVATLFRSLLQLAERRVRITTAYFVPDDELTDRLCDAADRGVEVEILLPGPHADKRFVQVAARPRTSALLERRASWNFQPTMLHAKVMTVDGHVANIGSANLNRRSMALDEEINVVVLDDAVTARSTPSSTRTSSAASDRARALDRPQPMAADLRLVATPFRRFF